MSLETGHFYEFENFRLDPSERSLLRDGKPVSLTPKAFHLLRILVENHGRVVEKEKLISEIWADSFVEDQNLAVSAAMLRKALDDSAGQPTFIETVPRRGYRFIAEVRTAADQRPVEAPSRRQTSLNGRLYILALMAGLVIIAAGALNWFAGERLFTTGPQAPILAAPFSSTRFSTSGTVTNAVISPDGKFAAYTDASGGSQSLWVRQLETGENIQIVPPSDDHYFGLVFSARSSIYFVRRPNSGHGLPALYRVAAFGGIPVKIVDGALQWFDTAPDDSMVSFVRCSYRADEHCALFVANSDGSGERMLLSVPEPIQIKSNQFSPDGRTIAVAYGQFLSGEPDFRIQLIDVAAGSERNVQPRKFFDIRGLSWLPGGDGFLFTVRDFEDGQISIWRTSIPGGTTERVSKDAASYQDLSIDALGERMIATQVENDFRIYVSAGGTPTPVTSAGEMTVSPDGRIAYSSFDGDIWVSAPNGGGRRQVTSGPAGDLYPKFASDGRYIFFRSDRSGSVDIWRMGPDGTGLIQITQEPGGFPCGTSSDGQWLYYVKDKKLGKVAVDGGESVFVSDRKMLRPVCSPDGNSVAYFYMESGFKVGVAETVGGSITKSVDFPSPDSLPVRIAWSADSKTLYFATQSGGQTTLWSMPVGEGVYKKIADLGGDEIRDLEILPDGTSYMFIRGKWINDAVLINGLR